MKTSCPCPCQRTGHTEVSRSDVAFAATKIWAAAQAPNYLDRPREFGRQVVEVMCSVYDEFEADAQRLAIAKRGAIPAAAGAQASADPHD